MSCGSGSSYSSGYISGAYNKLTAKSQQVMVATPIIATLSGLSAFGEGVGRRGLPAFWIQMIPGAARGAVTGLVLDGVVNYSVFDSARAQDTAVGAGFIGAVSAAAGSALSTAGVL